MHYSSRSLVGCTELIRLKTALDWNQENQNLDINTRLSPDIKNDWGWYLFKRRSAGLFFLFFLDTKHKFNTNNHDLIMKMHPLLWVNPYQTSYKFSWGNHITGIQLIFIHGSVCNICCSVGSVLQKKKFSLHRWTGCLVNMLCRSLLYNGCIMKQFMCRLADLVGMDHWEIKETVFYGLLLYWTV